MSIIMVFMKTPAYRILDANLNRAREGLRVTEEYLRFIRQEARGAWILKRWRHQLREMADRLGPEKLLSARAAGTDVGKDLGSPSQSSKQDPAAITAAGLKRLQEALRVIEEYSAALDATVSETAGKIRFECYQFEKELFLGSPREKFLPVRLYLLIGSDFCPVEKMPDLARQLLEAGVDCLQLREKHLKDKELFRLAEKLGGVCRDLKKLFIVNDRPDIALAIGADGVHVGQDDLPIDVIRRIVNSDQIIGVSTHNPGQLQAAIEAGPDYIAIGPAFDTATKPHEPTAGPEYISQAVTQLQEAGLPEVAIGGITPENLPRLISLGARRIAVCGAILSAENPIRQAQVFASLLNEVK